MIKRIPRLVQFRTSNHNIAFIYFLGFFYVSASNDNFINKALPCGELDSKVIWTEIRWSKFLFNVFVCDYYCLNFYWYLFIE